MRQSAGFTLLLAVLWGCSHWVVVPVPPRMDLKTFGTLGIVEFTSNHDAAANARATREFQAHVHSAQPGTPLLELGARETVLAAVGGTQFDAETLRKIGQKYGVEALFVGEIVYSEPKTDYVVKDLARVEGAARTAVRGDVAVKLMEARSGASIWSSSAWARRETSRVDVSLDRGVSGKVRGADPREEMIPSFIWHLTADFRSTTVSQRAD
jgi:hypothetical protein